MFCSNEDVSYLSGWLGDATLPHENSTPSIANDDYCADLDAENIFRHIIQGQSSIDAINAYYGELNSTVTRADVFLSYISYSTVKGKIFYELIDKHLYFLISIATRNGDIFGQEHYSKLLNDEQYHMDSIKEHYPDTYNFLLSLQDRLANMATY